MPNEPVSAAQLAEQVQIDAPELIQILVDIARNGERDMARIKAVDILLTRGYGKVGVTPRTNAEEEDPMAGMTIDEKIEMLKGALADTQKEKIELLSNIEVTEQPLDVL